MELSKNVASSRSQNAQLTSAGTPNIAVIIPTRNRLGVLPRAIESVFEQDHSNFELIVVDDCSDDGTAAYLESITDKRIKWHRFDEWRRGNAARNAGVALSSAPIITFLDSDDQYRPERLTQILDLFAKHPDIDVQISSYLSVSRSGSVECKNTDAIFTSEEFERYLIGYCLFLGGSGISLRRRAFDEIDGFDEDLIRMQDREFLLRAARTRGCQTSTAVNWIKFESSDSLSRQPSGQVTALAALCNRHSVIEDRYPEIMHYLVAREIVRPLFNMRFRDAANALREAKNDRRTYMRLTQIPKHYIRGKRRRKSLRRELTDTNGGIREA